MPKTTPEGHFPIERNAFTVELYEMGNAPDYSFVYDIGVKAARGQSESYTIKNCPKNQDNPIIDITGNPGTDMAKFNYIGIDYGNTGDGKKWFFVVGKTILNYPEKSNTTANKLDDYAMRYELRLDVWETYKDKLNSPIIKLDKVTTNNPEGWTEYDRFNDDILSFSAVDITTTDLIENEWKKVIGWQAKKPTEQDNYIIDGMVTPLKYSENLEEYKQAVEDLASEPPQATNIFKTFVCVNSYVLPSHFSTEDGGYSTGELLNLATPDHGLHGRLNYYPYKRAFLKTIDGQCVEFKQSEMNNSCLGQNVVVGVNHSTTPTPHSILFMQGYKNSIGSNFIVFSAYPHMDITGKVPTIWEKIGGNLGNDMSATGMDGLYW